MTMDRPVASVGAEQQASLVETLALAFQSDPAFCWILTSEAARKAALPRFFKMVVPGDLASGVALASPGHEVATLWRAPGKAHSSALSLLWQAVPLLRTFGLSLGRAMAIGDAIDAHHPKDFDFWYLHYAAVRPAAQGKGWGGSAIRAGLARAASQGKPVYLETATPENVGLYQRLGFDVTQEWDVPNGGPHFWSMIRR